MALVVDVLQYGTGSHTTPSEAGNFFATDFVSDGIVGVVAATSGVAPMTGGFAVNAQGTPDMTVAVTAGTAYVTGTPSSQNSQRLRVKLTANQNVTISANATGGTRFDWIYIKLDPTNAANPNTAADNVATLVSSRSTSASVDNGTPPTYGYHIATVTVTNGATSITNGNIADTRVQSGTASSSVNTTGTVSSRSLSNPYKFSVYRTSALTSANTFTAVAMDTKSFDTGTNVDVVTNKGRFTAPVAGFYHFSGSAGNTAASATAIQTKLYKNGAAVKSGVHNGASISTGFLSHVSGNLQLAANDYVELYFVGGSGSTMFVGADGCFFDGHLISTT